MPYLMVFTTTPTEQEAALLARSLVQDRLAACFHIHAIRSVYRWEGKVLDEPEWRLAIKTTSERFSDVEAHIRRNHSYKTPEIVCLPIEGGSAAYLRWISESVEDKTRAAK